jgi:hypothetical protein
MALLRSNTIIYGTANVQSVLTVGAVTPNTSISNTTGSLIVSGGVGITGNLYSGNHVITGSGNGITFADGNNGIIFNTSSTSVNSSITSSGNTLVFKTPNSANAMTIDTNGNVISANVVISSLKPAFAVYANTQTTTSASTYTKIAFKFKELDSTNSFDSVTNYRYQPKLAGWYQINGSVGWIASQTETYTVIVKNGTIYRWGTDSAGYGTNVSAMIYLNGSTDYIELFVVTAGSTLNVTGASATYFQGFWIRT